MSDPTRTESDSMGDMLVPGDALYGASTQRAVINFDISGRPVDPAVAHAYGLIKWAAAEANAALGVLDAGLAGLIARAAREVASGALDAHFPVDVYQTGSGTSTNTNVNEVIANRCSQLAGKPVGSRDPVHPNDHVNRGQSSNDTFPTAVHLAVALALRDQLAPALEALGFSLAAKADEFHDVLKIGRTHLMDATPVRLGQEFGGYAGQVRKALGRCHKALNALMEIPLGGTAVGTGLNRHPEFHTRATALLASETGLALRTAENPFEAQAARDALVEAHGQLNSIAASLYKVANDLRLLASGPRCGIGEIRLPATQPGSSIMPGKVNPVIPEAVAMVAARVFGNQTTVTWAGANGHLELNTFMPLLADTTLESVRLLAKAAHTFRTRCTDGITADRERCQSLIELSLSMVTALAPVIGYDRAAAIAKESATTGETVRAICQRKLHELGLTQAELDAALDPARMTGPGET
jgi:fumarate hydratase class II